MSEELLNKYKLIAEEEIIGGRRRIRHPLSGPFGGCWTQRGLLGSGGCGGVFLQEHEDKESVRAVKVIHQGKKEIMRREVGCMLKVKDFHRQFVNILGWYETETICIAMDYHHKGDLSRLIQKNGACDESTASNITKQILQGVFVLHHEDINIVHRDIKPENILVNSTSPVTIKLADFGLAKVFEKSTDTPLGTREWAAPEQLNHHDGVYSNSADMWSVGCVAYYLLTSLNPFADRDKDQSPEVLKRYTSPSWPRLKCEEFLSRYAKEPGYSIAVRGASSEVNDFLKRLIIPNPETRISSLEALQHKWICPQREDSLRSVLQEGDSPLFNLLYKSLECEASELLLDWAASGGDKELVDLLYNELAAQENPPTSDRMASLIVKYAAIKGRTELVHEFMRRGEINTWTRNEALKGAAAIGSLRTVTELLSDGQLGLDIVSGLRSAMERGHDDVSYYLWGHLEKPISLDLLLVVASIGSMHVLPGILDGQGGLAISKALSAAEGSQKTENISFIITTRRSRKVDLVRG